MNKHLGSSFEDFAKQVMEENKDLMIALAAQEERDKLHQSLKCTVCLKATDADHLKCTWCRTAGARQKPCKECGKKGRYKALGLCIRCYFRSRRAKAKSQRTK
jgi:hypothetical protein